MLCYVGKATKIFLFLVATLIAVGLFVTIGIRHHMWAHKVRPTCQGGNGNGQCSPDPAAAASVPPQRVEPNTSPPLPSISNPAATAASVPPQLADPTRGAAATSPPLPWMPTSPPFLNPPTDGPAGSIVAAPPQVFSPPSPVAAAAPGPGQA